MQGSRAHKDKASAWPPLAFPLALVLFEFSTYIANDMILPGMLAVIMEFGADPSLAPTALTAYLIGGASLQWLLGPLSDRVGRRPVMLFGVVLFTMACLVTLVVQSIEQFFLLRVIQGMGLCFMTSVGYATVQESLDEVTAVKVTALMANVALISPLLGPLAGAALITVAPWRSVFVAIAAVSLLSLFGLYRYMPESVERSQQKFSLAGVLRDYQAVLTNRRFIQGTLAVGFACVPLLAWLGQSPVILIQQAGLSPVTFGLWQLPIFGALLLGNFAVTRLTRRLPVDQLIPLGRAPLLAGLVLAGIAMAIAPNQYPWLVFGLSIYAFGLGIANAAMTRLTLFASPISKGTVAASFGIGTMLILALGIELVRVGFPWGGTRLFAFAGLGCGVLFLWCTIAFRRPSS